MPHFTYVAGLDKVINEYLDNVTIADLMKSGAAGDNYVI